VGLLVASDVPVSSEVNVAAAIFVLPLNSSLNPFLYNLNMLLEKRRKALEGKVLEAISQQIQ
jgi:hypothetical protein